MTTWEKIKPRGDVFMWMVIFILSVWGLLAIYSSTGALAYKNNGGIVEIYLLQQAALLTGGFFIMLIVHSIHYKHFIALSKLLIWISYILLIYTLIFGIEINGARRWINILGITFQASDFAKLAIVMFVTRELARKQETIDDFKKTFLPILGHITAICLLIAPENLSTAMVLFSTCLLILFIGRVKIKHLALIGGGVTVAGLLFFTILFFMPEKALKGRMHTWKNRVETFGKVETDPDKTYQNDHAKIAIATGGIFGKFPGNSIERNFLPEAYSDFIYAIIAEEYGLIGALFMLMLYMFFLYRAIRIVLRSPKAFGALIAIGLSFSLVLQALINMAVAVNLFPVTGLTLPLVSKGGTSILLTSVAFGVIMSVSRYVEEDEPEIKDENSKSNIISSTEPA
ncbi:MAG: cell division protein FtsW [Bacteroidia bacterium]|nr:cell division protein FtsW [Bacteroidia bacterium]MCC7533207.1 cell division protein FtsW [Bacteroidia bacterium]